MNINDSDIRKLLKSRTVLVIGADGFVGSHLTERLLFFGAKTHVLIRATTSGMLHNLSHIKNKITVHHGDLTDKQALRQILQIIKKAGKKAIIFHLGAQAHVGESWERSYETINTNTLREISAQSSKHLRHI